MQAKRSLIRSCAWQFSTTSATSAKRYTRFPEAMAEPDE
jgi:hypothetical protein